MTFTIVHPVTGDRAEAEDLDSAVRASQVLRADALDAGTCTSPRVECLILVGDVGGAIEGDAVADEGRPPHGQHD